MRETDSVLTRKQKKTYGPKPIDGCGNGRLILATVRFDDECGNGHNTFSITGEIFRPHARDIDAGGCLHDEIAKHFPELAPLIKWHLCSTDGPMHYPANTLYFVSDRDCWGKRKGEPRWIEYYVRPPGGQGLLVAWPDEGSSRILGPKVQKFRTKEEAQGVADACGGEVVEWVTAFGEGKAPELDAARRSAIWLDATDEELLAPNLKQRLADRLPGLMAEFRAAVESLGFTW